jgi:hypothetical protein
MSLANAPQPPGCLTAGGGAWPTKKFAAPDSAKSMKGLFNKVKNRNTRQRYVVSTIRRGEDLFETAVFAASLLFVPKSLSKPELKVETHSKDEAWDMHYTITDRLTTEIPARLFLEFSQN